MSLTLSGSGTIGGLVAGGLPDGTVLPADLSTGSPSWDSSGNMSFNSGYGSVATAYGCRAWVNFDGTGTVAIRASGNVSSITDNGTGQYTVNFATAMPDTNYAVTAAKRHSVSEISCSFNIGSYTTTSNSMRTLENAAPTDSAAINISIFR